ncbi:MAG: hypothetical protein E7227_02720, partial [Clostridiales bacterium]|nr:hypothetical protein [Clostridiales bacterium]
MVKCNFNNTITERDMDLLLAEAVATDSELCRLIVEKTDLRSKPFEVKQVEVSKSEIEGESDITVIIDVEGDKYGLLIEDKIGAPAMSDQHGRYLKRGDKGIKRGDYKDYKVFIFCPEKYRENNSEAKLYEHVLTYEDVWDYFKKKEDALSSYRAELLSQAIKKAKKPSSVTIDPDANAFFRQYKRYQQDNYPTLMLTTKETSNGWWPHFNTNLKNAYIHHKMPD